MRSRAAGRIARPRIDLARVPFQRTATYRRYDGVIDPDPLAPEHLFAKALLREQGFDGLPDVVSREELDVYVRAGELELLRGIAGPSSLEYAEQLRLGPMWAGRGSLGGGIYAAFGADAREHAAVYAQDPGSILVRMSVKSGARLAKMDELNLLIRRRQGRTLPVDTPAGLLAAYLGYDGVVTPTGVILMLNRTALRIQRENVQP